MADGKKDRRRKPIKKTAKGARQDRSAQPHDPQTYPIPTEDQLEVRRAVLGEQGSKDTRNPDGTPVDKGRKRGKKR